MESEIVGIRREMSKLRAGPPADRERSYTVDLHVVGVGRADSSKNIRSLIYRHARTEHKDGGAPKEVLLLGFAGALTPGLGTGDLVLASRYYREREGGHAPLTPFYSSTVPPTVVKGGVGGFGVQRSRASNGEPDYLSPDGLMYDQSLEAASNAGLQVVRTDSLTVNSLVTTSTAKAELGRLCPAGTVNMEDYWVALAAGEAGVPFLSVRAVLDRANQSLPGYLAGLARSRSRALFGAAAMPWRISALLALGYQMRQAQKVLTRFALSYVGQQCDGGRLTPEQDLAGTAR